MKNETKRHFYILRFIVSLIISNLLCVVTLGSRPLLVWKERCKKQRQRRETRSWCRGGGGRKNSSRNQSRRRQKRRILSAWCIRQEHHWTADFFVGQWRPCCRRVSAPFSLFASTFGQTIWASLAPPLCNHGIAANLKDITKKVWLKSYEPERNLKLWRLIYEKLWVRREFKATKICSESYEPEGKFKLRIFMNWELWTRREFKCNAWKQTKQHKLMKQIRKCEHRDEYIWNYLK